MTVKHISEDYRLISKPIFLQEKQIATIYNVSETCFISFGGKTFMKHRDISFYLLTNILGILAGTVSLKICIDLHLCDVLPTPGLCSPAPVYQGGGMKQIRS